MKNYRIYPSNINQRFIDELADALRRGEIIIYPTDTLYAIGCDATNNRAVERVCRLKGIDPRKQHLSVVCADISQASEYARIDNEAFRILRANLPGPFTFILPASSNLSKHFKGRKEAGIRVPDNEIARALAEALGNPILSTSVELQEDADPADPMTVTDTLRYENDVDAIVDGGEVPAYPSAIVSLADSSSPEIIREGPSPLA